MTLLERLAELRLHLAHLQEIRPRVRSAADLEADLSLRNDVLHSLQTVCQVVIDAAGDLAARAGLRFEDYTEAVRSLPRAGSFPPALARELERLPGFRNVLIHEYVAIDLERVVAALGELGPIVQFADRLADHLANPSAGQNESESSPAP